MLNNIIRPGLLSPLAYLIRTNVESQKDEYNEDSDDIDSNGYENDPPQDYAISAVVSEKLNFLTARQGLEEVLKRTTYI